MRNSRILTGVAALAFTLVLATSAAAQLAQRPAEDWTKTLDSPRRVAGLRISEVVAALKLTPGETIADIGAGPGLFEVELARAVSPGGTVYEVDIDDGFFADIERRAKAANVTNVRTVLGQFTDPHLPARNLDTAFFHDVLHHVEDRAGYLKSVAGYLKPSGRIVVIDYEGGQGPHGDQPDLQVTRQQLATWMVAAGLVLADEVRLFSDKYYLIYKKQ